MGEKGSSFSGQREQLLPRYHHSLHPWQGLWLLDSCITTNPPHHFCFSSSNTEVLQSRRDLYRISEDTQVSWSCKKRRKHVLDCVWVQITEKRPQQINRQKREGDSTPGFSTRYVSTESNTAQQPGETEEATTNALTKMLTFQLRICCYLSEENKSD